MLVATLRSKVERTAFFGKQFWLGIKTNMTITSEFSVYSFPSGKS